MRIRKLARELKLTDAEALGILHALGHTRYASVEQMLPTEVVEQVRKRGPPPLPKPAAWRPAEDREIRNLDQPAPRASSAAAVRPAPKPAPSKAPSPAPAAPPAASPAPVAPPIAVGPSSAPAELLARLARIEAELVAAQQLARTLDQELAVSEQHRRALVRALAAAEGRTGVESLAAAFARRGLAGEDACVRAVRAWSDAQRLPELLDTLQVGDASAFDALMDERLLLVGPGEDPPPGVVAVQVPAERSEHRASPAARAALARMTTVLLVHGLKRVVVHARPAAWQRELKEALDPRIDLRFYAYTGRGPLPDTGPADVVVLWDAAAADPRLTDRHPTALLVTASGLVAFCASVVAQLDRR